MKRNFNQIATQAENKQPKNRAMNNNMVKRESEKSHDQQELRFLVPSKAAGVIIGKGGDNVKDLRERFELKVNLPDSSGPERVLQFIGQSDNILQALELVLTRTCDSMPASDAELYIEANRVKKRRSKKDDPNNLSGDMSDEENTEGVDLRMLIHQSQAGGIIGKGGDRIKELRETTKLKILKVYQSTCPHSTDRIIQIAGDIPKVMQSIKMILELLDATPVRGQDLPYDARHYDEAAALAYGGWMSKGNFKLLEQYGTAALAMAPSGPSQSGAAMRNYNSDAAAAIQAARDSMASQGCPLPPSRLMTAAGRPTNPGNMLMMNMLGNNSSTSTSRRAMNFLGNQQVTNAGVLDIEDSMRGNSGNGMTKTVQVSVPNAYMGAIMGRGGTRIRSIREESMADIRVYEADKHGGDRIIDITGTQEQITYAQQLLKSCVLMFHDKK